MEVGWIHTAMYMFVSWSQHDSAICSHSTLSLY